jgi:hypothetical protein
MPPSGFKQPRQGSIDVSPAQGISMPPWWVTNHYQKPKPRRGNTQVIHWLKNKVINKGNVLWCTITLAVAKGDLK